MLWDRGFYGVSMGKMPPSFFFPSEYLQRALPLKSPEVKTLFNLVQHIISQIYLTPGTFSISILARNNLGKADLISVTFLQGGDHQSSQVSVICVVWSCLSQTNLPGCSGLSGLLPAVSSPLRSCRGCPLLGQCRPIHIAVCTEMSCAGKLRSQHTEVVPDSPICSYNHLRALIL